MLAAPNALAMLGGPITVILAVLLVAPAPVSFDEIGPVVLFCTPACMPVTFRLMVQEPFAASVPPERLMEPDPAAAVVVPPQVLERPFGVATARPAGRVSENATPVSARLVFGLLMLKVNDVLAFSRMLAAPNALVIVGGVPTVRFAVAVLPVPPLVEASVPVVFVYWPASAQATRTENWHWLLALMVAPVSAMPVGAVVVSVPPQTVEVALATVRPVGSVSVKATPVSAVVFAAGLVIVNCSEVVAFSAIVFGLNTLAIEGGATTFSKAVLLVLPVPPSVELMASVVLLASPATVPVPLTVKVHDALCATLAPLRLITPVPAVAVTVPPQVLATPFGVATTSVADPGPPLTGSVSLNATPLRSPLTETFGLLMVKVTDVVPFSGMLAAPKAFAIAGGATTVMLAVAVALVPPSVELTTTLLLLSPAVVPVTFTVTAQEALDASVPPDKLNVPEPAVAVAVPPQLFVSPFGVAITRPAGKLSVNDSPVRLTLVFGFVMLMVSDVVPFSGILVAPKFLVTVAGEATINVAVLLVAPVPPLVELTAPVVLVTVPDCVPVTLTTIVQVAPGVAIDPPVRLIEVELAVAVTVPPQLLVTPGVDATCNPPVSVSLNAIPFSALVLLAGLVIVKVAVVVPFTGMAAAPNALEIVGGATTFSGAVLLVVPVPPWVEVIAPVVLLASPSTVPVTFTVKVHDALCATLAPLRLITPVPAVAVTVPPQAGSVSLNATPLRSPLAEAFGLLMVNVTDVVPFSGMLAAPKAFAIAGGATTVIEAVAVLPVPPLVEVTCTLLLLSPAVVPVTFTTTVHDELGARLWPLRLIEEEPATAVTVPVQLPPTFGGVATTSPAGRLSVNATPVSVRFWLPLLSIVKVRLVVPFSGIVAAPNAFTICGGLMTVMLADEVLPLPASVERIWTLLVY